MGFSISDFWDTTPYEFSIITDGYSERLKQDYELSITNAYLVSRWVWAKKLPDLKKILSQKEKKVMTDDQMKQMAIALNKLFGGEVIESGN